MPPLEGVGGGGSLGGGQVTEASLKVLCPGCNYYILVIAMTQHVHPCVCVARTPLGKRAPVKILSTETEHNHQDGKQMAWKHCRGLSRELIVPSKPGPASPETLGLAKWPRSAGVLRPGPFPRGWGSKCRHSSAPCSFSLYCHPCTASQ